MSDDPRTGIGGTRVTHGRHCTCTPCAAQDWSEPGLAPCGMHGPDCPAEYQPIAGAGTIIGGRLTTALIVGYDPGDPDVRVTADAESLRQQFERELREDEMRDASDEEIVRHVYEQNCDLPDFTIEEAV